MTKIGLRVHLLPTGLAHCLALSAAAASCADGYNFPAQVKVLPVAFVPDGEAHMVPYDGGKSP